MRVAALALLCGCGRISFERRDDGGLRDSSADGANVACAAGYGPWSDPVEAAALTTLGQDWDAALHPDGDLLVFTRGNSMAELWSAQWSGSTYEAPTLISALSTSNEFGPAWSPAGDQLYFVSTRTGSTLLHSSDYVGGTFMPPQQVTELVGTDLNAPTLRGDGLEMYFSDDPNDSMAEIWRAERSSTTAPWSVAGVQSQLSIANFVGWPSIEHDGLTMYLEVDNGTAQIYRSTRANAADTFGPPTIVTELAGLPDLETIGDPEVSRDGLRMILAIDRASAATQFDLFVTTRSCL